MKKIQQALKKCKKRFDFFEELSKQDEYKTKTRLDNIDLIKALAIYLVVIYHFSKIPINIIEPDSYWNYFNLYLKSFFSICVPVFFFVNGVLLLNKEKIDIKKHIKKTVNIVILTVLWGFITLIALICIRGEMLSLPQIVKGSWTLKQTWNNHLWFLCALVVIYVFYPLIHSVYHSNRKSFYFFFVCVVLFTFGNTLLGNLATTMSYFSNKFTNTNFMINYFTNYNPFRGIGGYSIGYFMLGGLLGGILRATIREHKRKLTIIATLAIPISMLCLFLYAIFASLRSKVMWDVVWNGYDTIFTLINVVAIFIISLHYKSCGWVGNFISIVGKNSLGIYFFHWIIGNILQPFYVELECSTMFLTNIFYAFVILLCSLLLTMILKKIPGMKYLVSI